MLVVLLAIIIPVAVVLSKKKDGNDNALSGKSGGSSSSSKGGNLANADPNSVPADKKGTYYDPWTWADTTDFNVTYTDETVGGLPVIGPFSN